MNSHERVVPHMKQINGVFANLLEVFIPKLIVFPTNVGSLILLFIEAFAHIYSTTKLGEYLPELATRVHEVHCHLCGEWIYDGCGINISVCPHWRDFHRTKGQDGEEIKNLPATLLNIAYIEGEEIIAADKFVGMLRILVLMYSGMINTGKMYYDKTFSQFLRDNESVIPIIMDPTDSLIKFNIMLDHLLGIKEVQKRDLVLNDSFCGICGEMIGDGSGNKWCCKHYPLKKYSFYEAVKTSLMEILSTICSLLFLMENEDEIETRSPDVVLTALARFLTKESDVSTLVEETRKSSSELYDKYISRKVPIGGMVYSIFE
jgi:hypothetical protein